MTFVLSQRFKTVHACTHAHTHFLFHKQKLTDDSWEGFDVVCWASRTCAWTGVAAALLQLDVKSELSPTGFSPAAAFDGSGPEDGVNTLLSANEPVYSSLSQSSGEGKSVQFSEQMHVLILLFYIN